MKILFNRKPVNGPYGGGNQILNQLVRYLVSSGHEVCYQIEPNIDWAILMDVRDSSTCISLKDIVSLKKKGVKILHRINENDAHRSSNLKIDKQIIKANKYADVTVFVSEYLKSYFQEKGLEDGHVIWNAANRNVFFNEKINFVRLPVKIITHHWSDDILKGYKEYQKIEQFCYENPDLAIFTFMGRDVSYNKYFKNCRWVRACPYESVAEELRNNNLYVTASYQEPGANHVIEALSCGLPVHVIGHNSGSCEEYSKNRGFVHKDADDFLKFVTKFCRKLKKGKFGDPGCIKYSEAVGLGKDFGLKYYSDDMCKMYLKILEFTEEVKKHQEIVEYISC